MDPVLFTLSFFSRICCARPCRANFHVSKMRKPIVIYNIIGVIYMVIYVSCVWFVRRVEPYHFWLVMPFDASYWHQKQWCWTGLMRPCPYQASGSVVKVMIRLLGKEASIKTLIQSLAICLWPFLYFQERALSRCCSAARHCWQGMTEALIELNRHAQW